MDWLIVSFCFSLIVGKTNNMTSKKVAVPHSPCTCCGKNKIKNDQPMASLVSTSHMLIVTPGADCHFPGV